MVCDREQMLAEASRICRSLAVACGERKEGEIGVAGFLSGVGAEVEKKVVDVEVRGVLERLCKKIDVVRVVHEAYDAKTWKRCAEARVLEGEGLVLLGMVLVVAALVCGDRKFLNSCLKLRDGWSGSEWPAEFTGLLEAGLREVDCG